MTHLKYTAAFVAESVQDLLDNDHQEIEKDWRYAEIILCVNDAIMLRDGRVEDGGLAQDVSELYPNNAKLLNDILEITEPYTKPKGKLIIAG